ncbi:M20 family metallopeptidase [Geomesophilobacter sediminis]|uniref:M20/M25/M40 family metallo-hydrolase n=1 Tax=Geomesophilobacter sediminis TaxID=2798584 RepID=A0A8J7M3K4_9BACT|nr:M20/M25/M40 family metallo-hydrolase [Geomesophilobacter sediminis]MBJ6728003.1 M20/M25/M40 family metallo-hydrolase [Geomesophilobacter sediminis]
MSVRDRVWNAIDPGRLRRTFLELLDIYSPSGKEEDIQLYLEEILVRAGFRVERQEVEEDRYNLRVTMGEGEPRLYLVGHVDTVPAWDLEEFGPREERELIFGLGSADMKGGCVAMLEAWLALSEALEPSERPNVGLLFVVGEEENGDGSETFLASQSAPWVVIGEPTGLSACFAHYGYLEAGFVTHGVKSHSSMPELGHNAVESMLRVLLFLGNDALFNRELTEIVYSIRELHSSRHGFVVPDRCESWIDLHLPPDRDPQELIAQIGEILQAAQRRIAGLRVTHDFGFASAGYNLGTDNEVADRLRQIYRDLGLPLRLDAFRSHSDGNLFHAAGVKPVILGPGALETAHTADEQVLFAEVLAAARIYAALCLG